MELVIAAVVGGALLAAGFFVVIWKVVSAAVDNLLDLAVLNFGNERAARRVEEKHGGHETEP